MKSPRLTLDWRQYFKEFCALHGEPVRWGRRLLFPDGWSYHALDHKGPEWKPPTQPDLLLDLKKRYWEIRLGILRGQMLKLQSDLNWIDELQRSRSATLQVRRLTEADDGKGGLVRKNVTGGIDTQPLCERLVWLSGEIDEALRNLAVLNQTEKNNVCRTS
jgi:hypothetical protein